MNSSTVNFQQLYTVWVSYFLFNLDWENIDQLLRIPLYVI